jgi:type VI secretion system protein VasI
MQPASQRNLLWHVVRLAMLRLDLEMERVRAVLGLAAAAAAMMAEPTALAQTPVEQIRSLRGCTAIESDKARLDCYDAFLGVSPEIMTQSGAGKWVVQRSVSPIDDTQTVTLSLVGEGDLHGWLKTYRPSLVLRCKEKRTEAYVVTGMTGAGDRTRIRFRIDKGLANDDAWSNSTDREAVFYPGQPGKFIEALSAGARMYLEVHPFNASPTSVFFELRGLNEVLPKLRSACP